jgi:hypothetical protein
MFFALVLLQTLLLDNQGVSLYIRPLIYVAFIALLPMELLPVWVLLSGFSLGLVMDVAAGGAGLNCSATLLTAFARPLYLRAVLSRDEIREGGMPTGERLGPQVFLLYITLLATVHCAVYFTIEAATWSYFYLTAIRIVLSTAATVGLIYLFQLFYTGR